MGSLRAYVTSLLLLALVSARAGFSQSAASTAGQQLAFAGLRVADANGIPAGQISGIATDSSGEIFLLLDQNDGVRLLKTDAGAGSVLAEEHIGAKSDQGLALALDPNGNVYVAGSTSSGALSTTAGAAIASGTSAGTHSFVAKFGSNLNLEFVTFTGSNPMAATAIAATADAVFVTGSIFSGLLPATPGAAVTASAIGPLQNGFVERFSSDGSTLVYATYLAGAGGVTSPAAIAADGSDCAYVGGYTSAPDLPTTNALVPEMIGSASGFLAKLSPSGEAFSFSTFIPGGGITSLEIDPSTQNLLLAGMISLGDFPVATAQSPIAALPY